MWAQGFCPTSLLCRMLWSFSAQDLHHLRRPCQQGLQQTIFYRAFMHFGLLALIDWVFLHVLQCCSSAVSCIFCDYSVCYQLTHQFSSLLPSCMPAAIPITHFQRSFRGVWGPEFALNICLVTPVPRHPVPEETSFQPADVPFLTLVHVHEQK